MVLVLVVAIIVQMSIVIPSLKNSLRNGPEHPVLPHFSDDHELCGDS